MADSVKCPRDGCGGMVGRIKENPKSKMRVGQCLNCGRLVNIGKAEEASSSQKTSKQTAKPPALGKPGKNGKQSPAPARRSAGRAAGRQQRPVQPRADVPKRTGWGAALREFFEL